MKKIKILMCGLNSRIGGIEMFVMNYASKLDLNKVQIDFINVYDNTVETEFYQNLEQYGKIYHCVDYRKHPLKFIKQVKKIQQENDYDIFHYHMSSCAYLIPLIAAKKANIKKIIAHAHNDASDKGFIKDFVHQINKNFLPILSNSYFSCSNNAAKWFFPKKIYKLNKYVIIENAINISNFKFNSISRKELRAKYNINDDEIVYGNVGNLKKIKNHDFLIDVFFEIHKMNPNSKLIIIGIGEMESKLREKVNRLGIESNVVFLGKRFNVNDYLSAMDVYIFPSFHEGLGISYIEAQISGLKCLISTGVPEEADLLNNNIRINLDAGAKKWAELAEKLGKLKTDRANFSFEKCKYDLNNAAKKLEEEYFKLNRIKIVHFVYGIKNGGVEKVITSYFSNINRRNFDLHIITQGESDEKNLKQFKDLGFKVHHVTQKKVSILRNLIDIFKILKKYDFDISHCHMSNTNFFPLLYSKMCGIKIRISHSHNAFAQKNIFEKILISFSNLLCTNKMACSEEAASWLFGKGKNNVFILKNAIQTNEFKFDEKSRKKYREELKINDDDFVIGMVARFEEQKNHEFVLKFAREIIKKYSNVKFVFVGIGSLEESIKNQINDINKNNNFIFLSSRNDVNKLYSMFDLFILPSLYEGLGIVLVEAQISGLKCLTSNFVPKSVNFSENVLFFELEKSIWIKEIEKIVDEDDYVRNDYLEEVKKSGYDILSSSKLLENYYIDIYKRG